MGGELTEWVAGAVLDEELYFLPCLALGDDQAVVRVSGPPFFSDAFGMWQRYQHKGYEAERA